MGLFDAISVNTRTGLAYWLSRHDNGTNSDILILKMDGRYLNFGHIVVNTNIPPVIQVGIHDGHLVTVARR